MKFSDEGPSWWYQPHFPIDVYPNALKRFVVETAESLCVHPDMLATAVLPVAGTLIGNSRWVECEEDWMEPPKLWAAIIAEPGGKKSPALSRVKRPLSKIEDQLEEQHAHLVADWEKLPAKGRPDPPKPIRLVLSDITIETLGDRVRSHPRGVLVYRDELTGWLTGQGQYKGGRGDDRQQWLEQWPNDSEIKKDRRTGNESSVIKPSFVAVLGGIQPDKVRHIRGRDGDDGMLDRFLLCPAPEVEMERGRAAVDPIVRQAYAEMVEALYGLSPIGVGSKPKPFIVKLDVGGRALANDGLDNHFAQLNNLRRQRSPLRGAWGKVEAHVYRVALVLTELWHVCEDGPEVVDEYRMNDAWRVIDYFKHTANQLLAPGGVMEPETYDRAGPAMERMVLAWLSKQEGKQATTSQLFRGPLQRVGRRESVELLEMMEARGAVWVNWLRKNGGMVGLGERPSAS